MLLQLAELENTSLCALFFQDYFGYSGFLIFPYEFRDARRLADSTVWLLKSVLLRWGYWEQWNP